jgi:hypothetical protein
VDCWSRTGAQICRQMIKNGRDATSEAWIFIDTRHQTSIRLHRSRAGSHHLNRPPGLKINLPILLTEPYARLPVFLSQQSKEKHMAANTDDVRAAVSKDITALQQEVAPVCRR